MMAARLQPRARGKPCLATWLTVGGQRLSCCATCCPSVPVCAHAASLTSLYVVFLVLLSVLWKAHVFLMLPGTRMYPEWRENLRCGSRGTPDFRGRPPCGL